MVLKAVKASILEIRCFQERGTQGNLLEDTRWRRRPDDELHQLYDTFQSLKSLKLR